MGVPEGRAEVVLASTHERTVAKMARDLLAVFAHVDVHHLLADKATERTVVVRGLKRAALGAASPAPGRPCDIL